MKRDTELLVGCAMVLLIIVLLLILLPILLPIIAIVVIGGGMGLIVAFPLVMLLVGLWSIKGRILSIRYKRDKELQEVEQYIQSLPIEYWVYATVVIDEDGLTDYDRRKIEVRNRYKRRLIVLWILVAVYVLVCCILAYVWFVAIASV